MFWIVLLSVWGGFLLGVVFMAVLFMVRGEKEAVQERRKRTNEKFTAGESHVDKEHKPRVSHG